MKTPNTLITCLGKFFSFLSGKILLTLSLAFTGLFAKSQCTVNAGNDTAVCLNEVLSLTATVPAGTVTDYTWSSIPPGTTISGNPFVVPTSVAGTYTYEVTATFDDGCTVADTIEITVDPLPVASFTFGSNNDCSSNPVVFTNTSSGIGLSYEWDFGDPNSGTANTSSATNPNHKFIGTPGTGTQDFTVTLIVTSSGGCKDTITQQITTKQSPGTELGGTGKTIYNGLAYFTTCSNSASANFTFTNQSSTAATNVDYQIIWGDGSPDFTSTNFTVASHTYAIGTYTLLFIVNGGAPNSCPDTATYFVFLGSNPAVGLNNPGNTTVCSGSPLTFPITGTFTNPPGTIYTTTFNDGSAPVVSMHPPPAGISHVFDVSSCGTTSSDGTNTYSNSFSAVIVASNPCGNSSSGVVPIYVSQKPEARFGISPNDTVCTTTIVTFTNTSLGNTVVNGTCTPGKGVWTVSPATGWTITSGSLGNDFGLADPTTWMIGSDVLRINFNTPGNYTIKFKTGTSAWCDLDSIEQSICVSDVPVAAFDVDQNIGCAPFVVNTTNNSSASFCGNNRFNWTISYVPTAGCSPATAAYTFINGTSAVSENPQIQFTNPGVYTITLVTTAPGGDCSSQPVTRQITVKDKPNVTLLPFADICENESVSPAITATCYTTAANYLWTFPSGSPSSSATQNPGTITFNNAGTYNISVDVTNECGTTTTVQPVNVLTVTTADAGPAQVMCGPTATMAANTPVAGTGQWSFIGGPNTPTITDPALPNTTITGLVPGTYTFNWTISNGSCVSSSPVTITIVDGPTPADAGTDQSLCLATSTNLAANIPALGTGQWSFISGPNTPAITDPALSNTAVTGLIPGVYTFRWTTSFSNCTPSTDDMQITVFDNPTISDAGPDQTVCSSTVTMAGNTPAIGNGIWTIISGPNMPAIATPSSPSTVITGLVPGTYIFQWTITNGVCPQSSDEVEIVVSDFPTTADAGADRVICAANSISLAGNTPAVGTGQWSSISGPNTPTITDPSLPNSSVTGLVPGTYLFEWTITNGVCPPSTDQVQIVINDNVTIADAGPGQHICGTSYTMMGNTPVIGTGQWTLISGPAGSVITNPSSPTTIITGLVTGAYIFQWTITNGSCANSSNVTIIIADGPTPANAGPDQNLCLANSVTLAANTPSLGIGQWSFINGPAGYTITDPSLPGTTVTGLVPGVYTFRWTTTFSNCAPSSDDVQITVFDNPTVSDAGLDQTICSSNVTMTGNTPVIGSGTWAIVSGPNSPAITNPSDPGTTITGLVPGIYSFQWAITNGVCPPNSDIIQVTVTPSPTISVAGPDQTLCNQANTTLAGNTAIVGTGQWSFVSGPNSPVITDPSDPGTPITGLVPGTYLFEWSIANSVCPPSLDTVEIVNLDDIQNTINNAVATICANQSITINGNSPTGGNGIYTYQWQISTDGGANWTDIAGAISQNLNIAPTVSSCFRRRVTSMPCETYSNVVCITVQAAIANNIIAADQSICINTIPATITGSTPTGGNGIYTYQWQISTDGGANWTDIAGANGIDYTPGALIGQVMYRRIVTTDLCNGPQASISVPVTISIYQDSKAEFTATPLIDCAPFDLGTAINVTHYPDRNGQYQWYANGVLFATNSTGVFPGYAMNNQGDTVIIKLVTTSPHGCQPDSMEMQFITITTAFANFTKSPASGCGPLSVTFTNTSSILDNSIEYFWNFGNGITANTMLPPNPVVYNSSPDFRDTTYYITLKAFNGCDTTYHLDSVTVFPDSKARFGVDTTRGCSPFTIQITNTSPGSNNVYYWDFGDGSRDTTSVIGLLTHTYTTGVVTTYTIRLIAENQCTRDTQTIDIVVSPITIQPFVSVFGNQLSGCAPHFVTFSNSSVGATQITWNFGDGSPVIATPGSQNIVTHTFDNAGTYTVTIRLQNDCSDTTITRTVTVFDPPTAGFDLSLIKTCTSQAITVTNTSVNANSYEWNWGDNSPVSNSSAAALTHTYTAAGVYTIRLVATRVHPSGFVCTDTVTRQVTVLDKILAQINIAPGPFCEPYTLDVSAGNISGFSEIEWIIYDSSTTQGEFHVNGLTATHVYDVPGTYSVKLIVRTTDNCVDSSTYQFKVFHTPQTIFESDITTCSHDTTVTYTAITTNTGGEPINYKWFVNNSIEGTLNPFTYHFQVPTNNTSPVEFTIRALAENAAGCGDTSVSRKLVVQPLPWPDISVSPSVVLQQPDYTFTFKDIVATSPDKTYLWDMGDRSGQTRDGQEVTYVYGDTGTYNVKLLVTDFSTQCSALDSVQVTVLYIPGYLYVPNAMCPGCAKKELREFLPLGKGLKEYRLRIFTTWGQKVFETTSLNADGTPNEPWDGTFNGKPLQQGSYGWTIEAKYVNDTEWKGMIYPGSNKPVKAGFITIIR